MEHVIFEGYTPHKVPVIVEVYTDNVNRTAPEVRLLFRKGQLGTAGSNKFLFDHAGIVEAHRNSPVLFHIFSAVTVFTSPLTRTLTSRGCGEAMR